MPIGPEDRARDAIDALLTAAGWVVQDMAAFNRNAAEGVAVREFVLPNGPCDYLLFVGGKAAGVIEAKKSGVTLSDFKFTTSNKQLNFMQHILTIMDTGGRAAVVLPDNVLFEAGSAGEGIRRRLLMQFDFHTLLRLPTGIFYANGVKANVLFFDKHAPRADGKANTKALWVYDFRTNKNFTLKKNPLKPSDLEDFVANYRHGKGDERKESERFKKFPVEDLLKRDKLNLDIFWLKDDSLDDIDSLPPPDIIAAQIVDNLQAALEAFQSVAEELKVEV